MNKEYISISVYLFKIKKKNFTQQNSCSMTLEHKYFTCYSAFVYGVHMYPYEMWDFHSGE